MEQCHTLNTAKTAGLVSRLDRVTADVNRALESFELGDAQQRLHEFIWNDYCDWYIEMAKIRVRNGSEPSPLPTLAHVLERILRLLHPVHALHHRGDLANPDGVTPSPSGRGLG